MANTIKLKRGSGSDPGSSDLVVGEIAVRTDSGKLFTKKDDNSIAEISGGGISDGDKGDITVSSSGATWTIDNDAVTFAKMQEIPTARLIGRTSGGTGNPETLAAGDARTLLGLAASATTDTTNASNIGSGTLAAARVATLNQDTTGSSATLTTARTIAGTSFDGSANIDISYANLTNKLSVGDGGLTQNNFTNTLKSKLDGIATGATNVSNTNQLTNGAGFITATLTQEQVEDYVGGMLDGTETGISVSYDDTNGNLDFVVASQTDNNFTTTLKNKLDGIAASATNVTNNNQLTNGASYITSSGTSAACSGNAATATALATARTIAGVSFDGTGNISLNNNAITNGASYVTSSIINSLNASNLDSGTVGTARLGSGTANSSSYLRGDGAWSTVDAGATGGSSDKIFWENGQTVTANYTIGTTFGAACNALSAGPITINSSVTITIDSGDVWVIV